MDLFVFLHSLLCKRYSVLWYKYDRISSRNRCPPMDLGCSNTGMAGSNLDQGMRDCRYFLYYCAIDTLWWSNHQQNSICILIMIYRTYKIEHLRHLLSSTATTLISWVGNQLEAWMCPRLSVLCRPVDVVALRRVDFPPKESYQLSKHIHKFRS